MSNQIINGTIKVLERDQKIQKEKNSNAIWWECLCLYCGKEFSVDGRRLRGQRSIKSCGCQRGETYSIDYVNQKIGQLLILEETEQRENRSKVYKCLCDCGKICYKSSVYLRKSSIPSCGCASGQNASFKDLTGEKFNLLTAIHPVEDRTSTGRRKWLCRCECGNTKIVGSNSLINGDIVSCGCYSKSQGVLKIEQLLSEKGIIYETEKRFPNCQDKLPLPFDFYVNNEYLIEYDGEQHFNYNQFYCRTEKEFKRLQLHDKIKNDFCLANNIPLIRIPYTLKDIKYEDINILTSKFLIKK